MIVDWLKFLPALVLLLTPLSLFYGEKTRYRDISRDWDQHWTLILTHGSHAIDLGRAALGTWWLLDSLQTVPNAHGLERYLPLLTQGSIRILAVLLQTVVCREPEHANAPFAFVTGLLLGGSAPVVALFALALAIPVAAGSRTPIAFFPLVAIAHFAIGFWFKGKGAVIGLSFGAIAATIPVLWSFMFHRDLVVAYRAKKVTKETALDPMR